MEKVFDAEFGKYCRRGNVIYLVKPFNYKAVIMEKLKPFFGIYSMKIKICTVRGKKSILYRLPKVSGKYYEVVPLKSLKESHKEALTPKLIRLYFFRYILGLDTKVNNIVIVTDKNGSQPTTLNGFKLKENPVITGYKISTTKVEGINTINPKNRLLEIFLEDYGSPKRTEKSKFIQDIRRTIAEVTFDELDWANQIYSRINKFL